MSTYILYIEMAQEDGPESELELEGKPKPSLELFMPSHSVPVEPHMSISTTIPTASWFTPKR